MSPMTQCLTRMSLIIVTHAQCLTIMSLMNVTHDTHVTHDAVPHKNVTHECHS